MKIAVLILGILGAVFGLLGAIFALGIGGLGSAFESAGSSSIVRSGIVAIVASSVGLVGAILAMGNKSRLGGWLMIGSAVVGFVVVFVAYIMGGIFFLIGGIAALRLKPNEKQS